MINLACGDTTHPDWVNIDHLVRVPGIVVHDLRKGIPFANESVSVVYNAHFLEHLPKEQAAGFLRECRRVLEPGGIIRVVVPDLEAICRLYLQNLHEARAGKPGAIFRREWMVLELYDQVVRSAGGGDFVAFLRRSIEAGSIDREFVGARWGPFGLMLADIAGAKSSPRGLDRWLRASVNPSAWKQLFNLLRGAPYRERQFRKLGENHRWMYDSFSLAALLESCGFEAANTRTATESAIPRWAEFHLDNGTSGEPRKPDSLYMEARARAR